MPDLKMRRRDRRVVLTLLTDAGNLSGWPLARIAQVSTGRVYAVLVRLEDAGYVTGTWGDGPFPRRRFYRLTPQGRAWAHEQLGLEPRHPINQETTDHE